MGDPDGPETPDSSPAADYAAPNGANVSTAGSQRVQTIRVECLHPRGIRAGSRNSGGGMGVTSPSPKGDGEDRRPKASGESDMVLGGSALSFGGGMRVASRRLAVSAFSSTVIPAVVSPEVDDIRHIKDRRRIHCPESWRDVQKFKRTAAAPTHVFRDPPLICAIDYML